MKSSTDVEERRWRNGWSEQEARWSMGFMRHVNMRWSSKSTQEKWPMVNWRDRLACRRREVHKGKDWDRGREKKKKKRRIQGSWKKEKKAGWWRIEKSTQLPRYHSSGRNSGTCHKSSNWCTNKEYTSIPFIQRDMTTKPVQAKKQPHSYTILYITLSVFPTIFHFFSLQCVCRFKWRCTIDERRQRIGIINRGK